jgi:hypothetical protein
VVSVHPHTFDSIVQASFFALSFRPCIHCTAHVAASFLAVISPFWLVRSTIMADVEKDHANGHFGMSESVDRDTALHKIRTAGSISISPELFEKIYLSPKNQVSNNLRSTFGNPTPLYEHLQDQSNPGNSIDNIQCSCWLPSLPHTSF